MLTPAFSRADLSVLAQQFHHVRAEHARVTSASVRRKMKARLVEQQARFERMLLAAVPVDEDVRRAWREHLHSGAPAPSAPRATLPIVFRGRSEVHSELVVRDAPNGDLAIEVDGAPYDRRRALDLIADPRGALVHIGALPGFREAFELPREAIDALGAWVERPRGEPPWRWAPELVGEGLIDRHFALTDRGRRALGSREAA